MQVLAYTPRLSPLVESFLRWVRETSSDASLSRSTQHESAEREGSGEGAHAPDTGAQNLLRQQGALEGSMRLLTVLLRKLQVPVDMVENGSLGPSPQQRFLSATSVSGADVAAGSALQATGSWRWCASATRSRR